MGGLGGVAGDQGELGEGVRVAMVLERVVGMLEGRGVGYALKFIKIILLSQ